MYRKTEALNYLKQYPQDDKMDEYLHLLWLNGL